MTLRTVTVTAILSLSIKRKVKYHCVGGTDVCNPLTSINSLQDLKFIIRLSVGQIVNLGIITISSPPNSHK